MPTRRGAAGRSGPAPWARADFGASSGGPMGRLDADAPRTDEATHGNTDRVLTVLVIDDEGSIRTAIRLGLEDAGHAVLEAANGRDGLDMMQAATGPLVVSLDLMMPVMSGVELLHAVGRDADLAARLAFVICTGAHEFPVRDLARYLARGRLSVVEKPFDIDTLVAAIEAAGQRLVG